MFILMVTVTEIRNYIQFSNSFPQLSPEEQRRRQLRRERNRVAALRCREKRKERANALRKVGFIYEYSLLALMYSKVSAFRFI